jgi:hypothetical protein
MWPVHKLTGVRAKLHRLAERVGPNMKRFWITIVAVGMFAIAAIAPAAAQEDSLTIDLDEVDGSGVSGTATLTEEDGQTNVVIELEGTPEDGVHPAHIHSGTCDDLGDVVFPLEDVVDGMSESTVEASIDDILAADHAINVHLSADEMNVYVACGEITDEAVAEDDDEAVAEDDDEAVAEDDDEAVTDDDDEAATDDEDEMATDDEEEVAVTTEEETDDTEDIVPATGSVGGFGPEAGMLALTLVAGATLGAGLLVRRRMMQT